MEIPSNFSEPAKGALAHAGITTLEQAAKLGEKALLKLHGLGPKTIRMIKEAIGKMGLKLEK